MSEREFLELLNLYLDREITPADADRLEKEIRSDAGRHRTYLQYCRMQQAVRLLGGAGGLPAERSSADGPAAEPGVIRAWWGSRWVWTGAVAATAAVVLAFAARRVDSGSGRTTPEDRLAAEPARREAVAAGRAPSLGLSGDALLLSTFPAGVSTPKVHEDQFNWMRQFQLVSLESRLAAQPPAPSALAPQPASPAAPQRPAGEDAAEMAAFKFVK